MDVKMKKIVIVFITTLFFIIGCNDSNSILEPEIANSSNSISKDISAYSSQSDISTQQSASTEDGYKLKEKLNRDGAILSDKRSKNRTSSIKTKMSKNFTVDGSKGATLMVSHRWKSKGKRVKLSAKLKIPRNAFQGELNFDMIFDLENYALELYPSPYKFDQPVILDLTFKNVDFSKLDISKPDFIYLDGEEEMKYKNIKFDPEKGIIDVKGAELHHFSRYGWTRRR